MYVMSTTYTSHVKAPCLLSVEMGLLYVRLASAPMQYKGYSYRLQARRMRDDLGVLGLTDQRAHLDLLMAALPPRLPANAYALRVTRQEVRLVKRAAARAAIEKKRCAGGCTAGACSRARARAARLGRHADRPRAGWYFLRVR